ncbi:MAG: hypothetical protein WC954_01860 [Sphaerochaeta sp.]
MALYHPFDSTYNDEAITALPFATAEAELPAFLLQRERKASYLYDGETLTPWYWQGIALIDNKRSVYFPPLKLFSFTELATTRRSEALVWVRRLAEALTHTTLSFLDLSSGILPLWRIWGVEDGSILILNQDLGDLFAATANDENKYFNISSWVHHGLHGAFTLCDQLTQLLYYAITGIPPFAPADVRIDRYRHLPLKYAFEEVNTETRLFIDESLSLSLTKQRDTTGNKEPQKALTAFLAATEELVWNASDQEAALPPNTWQNKEPIQEFLHAQATRAKRAVFWRMKGWIVITIAVSVILVSWFTISRIHDARKPPYTQFMEPGEIVSEYYVGLNTLDLSHMDAALAKRVKNPWTLEVTNLFVTRQTRQAYEGFSPTVDPNEWIAEGKPPLIEGSFLYGTSDLSLTYLDEHTIQAQSTLYTPYPYDEEVEEGAELSGAYLYTMTQNFSFDVGKRGWYEIVAISAPEIVRFGFIDVPMKPRFEETLQLGQ